VASYRTPRGTVVRHLPDWNINNCATIQIIGTETPGGITEAGLVNDATDGRFLVIWHLGISHIAGAGADPATQNCSTQVYNTAGILPYTENTPLNPLMAPPPGKGWFNTTSPGTQPIGQIHPILWGSVNWDWPHEWPLAIVPPGFSISVVFVAPSAGFATTAASFIWEATRYL
jgi:hypothetical protein